MTSAQCLVKRAEAAGLTLDFSDGSLQLGEVPDRHCALGAELYARQAELRRFWWAVREWSPGLEAWVPVITNFRVYRLVDPSLRLTAVSPEPGTVDWQPRINQAATVWA
jgi:hypothetical protein